MKKEEYRANDNDEKWKKRNRKQSRETKTDQTCRQNQDNNQNQGGTDQCGTFLLRTQRDIYTHHGHSPPRTRRRVHNGPQRTREEL